MREQEGLRLDIFRSFTSAKDTQGAIKALKRYGPDEPQLYVDALTYFASSPQIMEEAGDDEFACLTHYHKKKPKSLQELQKYRCILTTPGVLGQEFKPQVCCFLLSEIAHLLAQNGCAC